MKFGLTESEYELLMNLVIAPLKKEKAKVFIFGSRARGDFKKFSDIDILYKLDSDKPLGFIFLIKSNIEESNFPFKVDLVDVKDLAESYKESVLKDLVEI